MNRSMPRLVSHLALPLLAALALAAPVTGCKRSAPEGAEQKASATTTTNAASAPAKSSAASLVGTWVSADGDDTLTFTGTAMSRTYKKAPGAPKAAIPYTVAKEDGAVVTLAPVLELPNGKKMKLDAQVFTLVDADTISGGLAGKTPQTFKRSK